MRYLIHARSQSVYDIDYLKLKEKGYKGLLFDIDNTLVHYGDDSNPKVDKLFFELNNMGFKCVMVSDNNEERILRFIRNIDALYIAEAGKTNKRNGFKAGRVIKGNDLTIGIGGGLCNLANSLHLVILHSPIEATEVHYHSDALAADPGGVRVPFSAGTSVSYNYIDFRFRNNTNQNIQLLEWVRDEKLYVELRSEREFKRTYEIEEEDHHFTEEDGVYYRVSKIYKVTYDRETKEVLKRKLIRDNHSQVMFDYELIPKEQIR